MFIPFELVTLILALTLNGQVHTGEILGGHKAVPHSRPYMVLLEEYTENGKMKHCDGFLLNEEFVITAAHCKASSYTALLGVHNVRHHHEIQRVPVEQAFPHQDFLLIPNFKNDIMLLKLSSKVKFTENVTSIALADEGDGPLPASCLVSGWGLTDTNSKYMSPTLMEVNVTLTDSQDCAEEHFYCSEANTGPGKGDSGGPLVCEDGKAYGVVSFSITPESGDRVFVFTKIPDFRGWINSTIEDQGAKDVTIV